MKYLRIALGLYFAWSAAKVASVLARASSVDRVLFEAAGHPLIPWILLGLSIAGSLVAIHFVWKPSLPGFWTAVSSVLFELLETATASVFGLLDPQLMQQAVVASREARGLPLRAEMLELMSKPIAQLLPLGMSAVWSVAILALLVLVHRSSRKPQGTYRGTAA